MNTSSLLSAIVSVLIIAIITALAAIWTRKKTPPSLSDPIPFLFNSFQFTLNNDQFMNRVAKTLKKTNLAKFYLFSTPVFLLSGPQNIQTIFAHSHRVGVENLWVKTVFPVLYGMPKEDVQRFADDKSGRDRQPAPSTEHIPLEHRYWYGYSHVHSEYLSKTRHFHRLARYYHRSMSQALDEAYPAGQWVAVSLNSFCRQRVAAQSIDMLFGPRIFELNPRLLDAFWEFDESLLFLLILPKWLASGSYRARERYFSMIRRYLDAVFPANNSDSVSPTEAETDCGPDVNGSLIVRMLVKWVRDSGLHEQAATGTLAVLVFALISNTVPTTMWMILEVVKDPSLLQAVRAEVATACIANPKTGSPELSVDKLVTLPLLQSIFTETLRLRINFNLMRNVNENLTMDGFMLRKGSMLQAPMPPAHYDEVVWGCPDHPAAEFWAERHIKYQEIRDEAGNISQKRVFAMAGRPSSYFPFGGGHQICPGRHLAKSEILTTVALLVSKFDIELTDWTRMDGSPSDRPARNDPRYSGVGAMYPDRDLKMQWKRIK